VVVAKIDETIEKISESTYTVSKLLAVHNERINNLEKDNDDTNKEIKDITDKMENNTREILKEMSHMEERIEDKIEDAKDKSSDQHSLLSAKVDKLDERLNELEKWRWYIAGGIALTAFVLSNRDSVLGFLNH
jgi:chromosome segregation ATPase